jgi:hypothetical protein
MCLAIWKTRSLEEIIWKTNSLELGEEDQGREGSSAERAIWKAHLLFQQKAGEGKSLELLWDIAVQGTKGEKGKGAQRHRRGCMSKIFLPATMAHTCNPSYSGGRDQEDCGSKPAWAKSS